MERKDLLEANAEIFSTQGRALQRAACATTRVLVVGNPANTNCLIARANAPALPDQNWSAMTRLDDNRLRALLAAKAGAAVGAVRNTAIWGNHSSTQFPDIFHATDRRSIGRGSGAKRVVSANINSGRATARGGGY